MQKLCAVARKRSVSWSVTGYQLKLGTTMKCYRQVISWDGMGWDGNFWKIVPSHGTKNFFHSIPWDGIPLKNLSSHPMGWFEECLSHGTIFYVPSHPKQTKFFKNAFKRTKRDEKLRKSGRVWMAIGVPNCERNTPIFDLFVRLNAFSVKKRV